MGLDGQDGLEGGSTLATFLGSLGSLSVGDVMVVLAALFYTFHCIRLERYAKETSAVKLAAAKATTELLYSIGAVVALSVAAQMAGVDPLGGVMKFVQDGGNEIMSFLQFASNLGFQKILSNPPLLAALGAVLWTGLIPVGYTICAQSFGQSRVSPTDANLIYTIQPIFTALVAWTLLGETLGPAGYIGGGLIGSAVYLVATDNENEREYA